MSDEYSMTEDMPANKFVVTAPFLETASIVEYHGTVTGFGIVGTNVFRDFFASVRDFLGGRVRSYEKVLEAGREIAMINMIRKATERGANAIVSVSFDHEGIGKNGSILMVTATGTAVSIIERGPIALPHGNNR